TIPEEYFIRIAVVGVGRLGSSLARGLRDSGRELVAVASRDSSRAERLAASLGSVVNAYGGQGLGEAVTSADAVFLTVPDSAIGEVPSRVEWRPGQAVVHCSGALGLEVLAPAARHVAFAGCLHPLQSFPSV